MLPWLQSYLQTLVVRDVIVVVAADYCVHHIDVASEHLVKVPTLSMGHGAAFNCRCEVVLHQCLTHHRNMVVEVPTNDDRGMWVLPGDVLGDIDNSFGAVFQLLLLSWLDVAVEHLYDVVADLQLRPA